MARLTKAWPCALSALLLLLAFPPVNLGFLVMVALVPWLWSLGRTTRRGAWKSGYTFGLLYGLGQLWFIASLTIKWTGNWVIGLFPWLLASFAFAVYIGWAGVLIRKALLKQWLWLVPVIWAGIEVFRCYIPVVAFPWALVATPLWKYTPLAQSAYFGSVFLVSAWVVLVNVIFVRILEGDHPKRLAPYVAAFLVVLGLSLVRWLMPIAGKKLMVTAAQPGVDMAFTPPAQLWSLLSTHLQPIVDKASSDGTELLVMPEAVLNGRTMPPLTPFYGAHVGVPYVAGGRRGDDPAYQSAFAFDGKAWKFADKTRLVIFGEFVPGREQFPFIAEAFKLPSGDMSAGTDGVKALDVAGIRIGPVICFEAAFPEIAYYQARNGAQVLAVLSIDDWYMGTPAPDQLKASTIWRSIETGLPVVRSASLGYTLVTDCKGRILAEAPLGEPRALKQEITLPERSGFVGFTVFPLGSLLAVFAFGLLRPRQRVAAEENAAEPELALST